MFFYCLLPRRADPKRENNAMYLRLIAKVVKIIETAKSFCINI